MNAGLPNQQLAMASASAIEDESSTRKRLGEQPVLSLVLRLCQTLADENVNYCHWKSNAALARSASGENDLDLLVSRSDAQKFTEILCRHGFRLAVAHAARVLPGVLDYYGYDQYANRWIHVHAHFQLVLGNDLSKNYRIPIEEAYLASATQHGIFRIPAPEYELAIFVLRMVLKHSTWDSLLMRHGSLSPSERRELHYLATPENLEKVHPVLAQSLRYVNAALFDACVQALQPGCSVAKRIRIGEQLQSALDACARRPHNADVASKLARRIEMAVRSRLPRRTPKRRPANGGLLIAIVGGDGSGKSTAIDGACGWLSQKFDVMRVHMGKPEWSVATVTVRALLKCGTLLHLYSFERYSGEEGAKFPGYPWFIRAVCTARDRYLTYRKARRFASNGGLAVCDRFPLPGVLDMDAPRCAQAAQAFNRSDAFLKWLARLEDYYYSKIAMPDLLIVLKVDPETAVRRKTDESEGSVRKRSSLVWACDWTTTSAHVVDGTLPKDEVLAQVQNLVWQHL